jgi:hypothetical protein
MSGNPQECREHARKCLEKARSAASLPLMAKFQSLAHSWLRLAEDLERAEVLRRRFEQPERKASQSVSALGRGASPCGVAHAGTRTACGCRNTEGRSLASVRHRTGGCSGPVAARATCILLTSDQAVASSPASLAASLVMWAWRSSFASSSSRLRRLSFSRGGFYRSHQARQSIRNQLNQIFTAMPDFAGHVLPVTVLRENDPQLPGEGRAAPR